MAQSNVYTNVSQHLINTHTGTPLLPGRACEVSDDDVANERFQEMLAAGEIISGEPPPESETKPAEEQPPATQNVRQQQPSRPPTPSKEA